MLAALKSGYANTTQGQVLMKRTATMNRAIKTFGTAAILSVLTATGTIAQMNQSTPPQPVQDNMQRQRDQPRMEPAKRSKPAAPSPEQIRSDAAALTKSMNLSCDVSDAKLLADGTADINGKSVHVRTYETACSNGLGYFLVDQAPEPPIGFTCFSADAAHAADVAAGRDPQPTCALPANADLKKAAGTVLSRLGQQCNVTALRTIGRDTKANTELTEAACSGGTGFVIASPLPGSTQSLSALNCPESYRRGVSCKLSSNGAPLVTLDTFKQALAQHKVACTVENTRMIGRQNASKRHVVEFKCPEHPEGLVAFIPLEDSTAPFETMSCTDAGFKHHIVCSLTQIR
jgi:hypothetical protein